jgi:hypothetical protein
MIYCIILGAYFEQSGTFAIEIDKVIALFRLRQNDTFRISSR